MLATFTPEGIAKIDRKLAAVRAAAPELLAEESNVYIKPKAADKLPKASDSGGDSEGALFTGGDSHFPDVPTTTGYKYFRKGKFKYIRTAVVEDTRTAGEAVWTGDIIRMPVIDASKLNPDIGFEYSRYEVTRGAGEQWERGREEKMKVDWAQAGFNILRVLETGHLSWIVRPRPRPAGDLASGHERLKPSPQVTPPLPTQMGKTFKPRQAFLSAGRKWKIDQSRRNGIKKVLGTAARKA